MSAPEGVWQCSILAQRLSKVCLRAQQIFAQAARDAVELERVTSAIQKAVEKTLQPASAVTWLKSSVDVKGIER